MTCQNSVGMSDALAIINFICRADLKDLYVCSFTHIAAVSIEIDFVLVWGWEGSETSQFLISFIFCELRGGSTPPQHHPYVYIEFEMLTMLKLSKNPWFPLINTMSKI